MCICINCHHVNNCSTYFSIEKQHQKTHLNLAPEFVPQYPVINVNIIRSDLDLKIDWDVVECMSFVENPGKWLILHET
uniref:hypothetical protein n=1 Tax=Madagascaria erythrocladioides TaxID=753684 RepID=UPI001BF14782|nr:hypothetical protein MW574_pgp107 [Madagascaria erythrocladioides]QUE29008.1 Ycf34 [Madagascaria erythrocladioides]UNJ16560.1 hypothetical protein [Madagascaria erythrocladioides]